MRRMREDHLHRNYSDVNERPIRCRAKLIQPKAGMAARLAMIPSAYNGTSCPATAASSVFVYTKTILLCKILVGNTQTFELHRADAGYAVFMIRLNLTPDPQSR